MATTKRRAQRTTIRIPVESMAEMISASGFGCNDGAGGYVVPGDGVVEAPWAEEVTVEIPLQEVA